MKRHSAANRLNVGPVAMTACYAHVDDASFACSPVNTPAFGLPTTPGDVDRSLARAYGVHVTGRAPVEVKGKGVMDMFWVDVVSTRAGRRHGVSP
jgi:hypothetical protein